MAKTKVKDMSVSEEPEKSEEIKKSEAPVVAEEKAAETPKEEKKTTPKREKGTPKPKKGKKVRSKKYQEAAEKVDKTKNYSILEAIEMAKEVSYTKFPGSLEIHINTTIKGVRGLVTLPYASGKKLTILAFGKGAAESGADIVGDDAKLAEIERGKVNFDVLVATPEWMPRIARLAKVLGPKGLMPNPKNGTVADDLKKTVGELQGGKTEYKSEAKANVVHLSLGKLTQPNEELIANTKMLLTIIGKSKIKNVILAPTMGPGMKIDMSSL